MDFYLMGVVFCKIQKQPNKRVVNSIRLNGIRLVCPLIYREGSLWDIDQKQTESWGWGNELLLTVWCFLRLLWCGFWTLGPKQIWVSDVVGEVSLSDLLFSWTLCIHQFIHLNIYQFLAAWKTRGFIQSISFNSLCCLCLCSFEQHLISLYFPFSRVNVTMQGCYVMGETFTILTLRRVTSQ